ncbi:glutathione S-transferase C-terminal domain-containing protein [Microbispora sp. RL4-1S]|uniref:Glutathione S-transferase C-terminal domain-containing protein n=1 Tax=Microbispora oryzae TaxID=2806554 RepID=A0A940WLJ9_9ACTN|nr:glutathione S-transferase C-terminal domain-containing protein [Microbispora oryzae]MBP2707716.1 glutathione S-transferase C-terminal domain-containing protein [Microbispora oryzae]
MTTHAPAYASPADVAANGPYGPGRTDRPGPLYPFRGRIAADGSGEYPAEPGRYHLYVSYTCPWAQRVAIVRDLAGLRDVVSLSYVDDDRDARGWAFRERRGPDPVNGFTLLSEAYDATEPGYPGHISVPVLWDRRTNRIVSNDYPQIPVDLGTRFAQWAVSGLDLYPAGLRDEIEALDEEIAREVSHGVLQVARASAQEEYERRRARVTAALDRLDARLAGGRYLFGDRLTESDVQLWVVLVRFDLLHNPLAGISERPLTGYPNLWAYARDLYTIPAFRETTDFTAFRFPGTPAHSGDGPVRIEVAPREADWDEPPGR